MNGQVEQTLLCCLLTSREALDTVCNRLRPEMFETEENRLVFGIIRDMYLAGKEPDEVSVENVSWTPLVMHTDGTSFAVYAVRDYTAELAAAHPVLSTLDDPLAWLRDTSEQVVNSLGDSFPIDA